MISGRDSLSLAPGVSMCDGLLQDGVRGCSWPLNESGAFVLGRAGVPLGSVIQDLSAAASVPLEVAQTDVLRFAFTLNGLALVNVRRSGSRIRRAVDWVSLFVRLAPAGTLPIPLSRRRALDTRSVTRAFVSSLRAAGSRVTAIAVAAATAAAQLAAIAGGSSASIAAGVCLGIGAGLGVWVHEAGHAACLRGVPGALVLRGRRTFVLHPPVDPGRRAAVAVAGPGTATAAGLALVTMSLYGVPGLVVIGLPLVGHALALTVAAGDGRVACGM